MNSLYGDLQVNNKLPMDTVTRYRDIACPAYMYPMEYTMKVGTVVQHLTSVVPRVSPLYAVIQWQLAKGLTPLILERDQMWAMGFPIETTPGSGRAVFYRNSPVPPVFNTNTTKLNVNAPEFVPGRRSYGSELRVRFHGGEDGDVMDRLCARCYKTFQMTRDGEYVEVESCSYHWGRMGNDTSYTCCRYPYGSRGCTSARCHVWNGTIPGLNGPLEGYVQAKSRRGGVYAVDGEMCYTTAGLELASIVFINMDGEVVYSSLVKPGAPVVDCNTRFSGITYSDLARSTKTLKDVQIDVLDFVGSDTILIGHALENDFRALKLIHGTVVDTSALYPHARGFPLRRSLKSLAEEHLNRTIQDRSSGHSPLEDVQAAMDLVLLRLGETEEM